MLIVLVHNLGDHPEHPVKCNYEYEVRINHLPIAFGKVLDFQRDRGWEALVTLVAATHAALTDRPDPCLLLDRPGKCQPPTS